MLAELRGKLDPDRVDPVERSEDLLTDAVFGAVRHLPYERVLGAVLAEVGVTPTTADLRSAEVVLWPSAPMPVWPGRVVQPDVIVTAGRHVVVFEAKLNSPFGSYHDPRHPDRQKLHQLAVQYAAVAAWAAGTRRTPPVVVAVTAPPAQPVADLAQAAADVVRLVPGAPPDAIRWLPWHRLAQVFADSTDKLHRHEQRLVADVLDLMDKRGVRHVFQGLQSEDYYLVTAATRVAADRLYPELRTFFNDLTAVLDDDGIGWSQPTYKGMWLGGGSTAVHRPAAWARSFVGAQYWPKTWPARGKLGTNLAL